MVALCSAREVKGRLSTVRMRSVFVRQRESNARPVCSLSHSSFIIHKQKGGTLRSLINHSEKIRLWQKSVNISQLLGTGYWTIEIPLAGWKFAEANCQVEILNCTSSPPN